MQKIKLLIIIVFAIALTACSTVRISASDETEPFLKHPLPAQSKILVVSAINDNFILQHGLSFDYPHLNGGNLDGIILQSVAQTLKSRQYQVATTSLANSQLIKIESGDSMIQRTLVSGFSQSMATGSMSLKPEVITKLRSLNTSYDADYIILITGGGKLLCPVIGSSASPIGFIMQMYLMDTRNNNVLTWRNSYAQESSQYSAKDNFQLCQEIGSNKAETPRKLILKQWLRAQVPQLARQTTQDLLASENSR